VNRRDAGALRLGFCSHLALHSRVLFSPPFALDFWSVGRMQARPRASAARWYPATSRWRLA